MPRPTSSRGYNLFAHLRLTQKIFVCPRSIQFKPYKIDLSILVNTGNEYLPPLYSCFIKLGQEYFSVPVLLDRQRANNLKSLEILQCKLCLLMKYQSFSERQMATHQNSQLQERLIVNNSQEQEPQPIPTCLKQFKQFFLKEVQDTRRKIHLDGTVIPENNQNNLVKNTKYNILTFVPKVLYNQFKFFFNLFFLITALTQLVQLLKVGLFITYIGPLIMVLSLTMGKQAYDDFNTYKRDIQANSKEYDVVRSHGIQRIKSKDLRVGDIVKLEGGDRIPADMITLYSDNDQGTLFLKTDQLDGQTDWKLRKAVKMTQKLIKQPDDYFSLCSSQFVCKAKPPQGEIYSFEGLFTNTETQQAQKLTLQSTMWTTTVLTNGTVFGLVIYVGRQTRISMGGSSARTKFGILDNEINYLSKVLFFIMAVLTGGFILLQKTEMTYIPIQFMRMLILISSIIPISMRVNLDFAKLFYAYLVNNDETIKGAVTRNSNCPEELGRVRYVLSDKTGTLTQNEMLFKQISVDDQTKFREEESQEIISILRGYDQISDGIDSKERSLKHIMTALALCHNVTPVFNEDKSKKDYQASSPDQITFVKTAEYYGISIQQRTQATMTIKMPTGRLVNYEIKYSFPFKSQTKRMGIILQNIQTSQITFYLKGADVVMKQFVPNRNKKNFIEEQCRELSMSGLRTLVMARKILPREFFQKWSNDYQHAYNRIQIDQRAINRLMSELEYGVNFLGITGIQDKLQNNLSSTIQSLRSGDIKVWMITGDKMETAQCISRSCGLQRTTEQNIKIEEVTTPQLWQQRWNSVKANLNQVLIIDGKTLGYVLQNKQISKQFFQTAMKMPTVVCCRCSPSQKKLLTQGVKKCKKEKEAVLGIGDGGNDVGMIQAADVGIGIVGKQGMQAALAADFSINQFRDIKSLLFWHGRLSYHRSSLLATFIIHRGFIISAIQLIFSCIYYYASIPVFNSVLQLGYATVFTFWPVFALILDRDIDFQNALMFPKLYHSLQKMDYLSLLNFVTWIWKAVFQATIIMVFSLLWFREESYLEFQTISFTILILTEYFMTFAQINRLHIYLLVCVIGSLVTYLLCLFFLNNYLHISHLTLQQMLFIVAIFGISWLPFIIWKLIKKTKWPTDVQRVMKNKNEKLISKDIHGRSNIGSMKSIAI